MTSVSKLYANLSNSPLTHSKLEWWGPAAKAAAHTGWQRWGQEGASMPHQAAHMASGAQHNKPVSVPRGFQKCTTCRDSPCQLKWPCPSVTTP